MAGDSGSVRVANGQGFWGESVDAPIELLEGGPIDYLGLDCLAEVTLSIMMRQKLTNPAAGYATDFLDFVRRALANGTKLDRETVRWGGATAEIGAHNPLRGIL